MDLTEAENIKKRWQEYTEELYRKDLHDQDNHDGVITYLEPDILECEVKWALGSITKTCKTSQQALHTLVMGLHTPGSQLSPAQFVCVKLSNRDESKGLSEI